MACHLCNATAFCFLASQYIKIMFDLFYLTTAVEHIYIFVLCLCQKATLCLTIDDDSHADSVISNRMHHKVRISFQRILWCHPNDRRCQPHKLDPEIRVALASKPSPLISSVNCPCQTDSQWVQLWIILSPLSNIITFFLTYIELPDRDCIVCEIGARVSCVICLPYALCYMGIFLCETLGTFTFLQFAKWSFMNTLMPSDSYMCRRNGSLLVQVVARIYG